MNRHSHGHELDPLPPVTRARGRTVALIALLTLAAFAAFFVVGFAIHHGRLLRRRAMAREVRDQPPIVNLQTPGRTRRNFDLTLPADVTAYATTALYARTNGFLASWKYDINDRVKKGDVLAVIAAPDTDAELEQAKAALNEQQTNQRLAQLTDERFRGLIAIQGVTQQQLDQNRAALEQAKAAVASARANVDRLQALVGFERILAPFDGVVTRRTYDVGALITASQTGAGQELFDVARDDRLRVYVNVPQAYIQLIEFGHPADLVLERNYPGHMFHGTVTRATGTLDTATRTLRTELEFHNDPAFRLFPGMYAQVAFHITRPKPVLTVPTSALLFEAEGKEVAIVVGQNRIHLQKVTLGSDFGTQIEVLSGLKGDERVVVNPGEEMAEGLVVQPAPSGHEAGS